MRVAVSVNRAVRWVMGRPLTVFFRSGSVSNQCSDSLARTKNTVHEFTRNSTKKSAVPEGSCNFVNRTPTTEIDSFNLTSYCLLAPLRKRGRQRETKRVPHVMVK